MPVKVIFRSQAELVFSQNSKILIFHLSLTHGWDEKTYQILKPCSGTALSVIFITGENYAVFELSSGLNKRLEIHLPV